MSLQISQSSSSDKDHSAVMQDEPKDIEKDALKTVETPQTPPPPPYTAFTKRKRLSILIIITLAGFLGPVSGNIYIPLLPRFEEIFDCSTTTINATVSVFMFVFALAPLIWASFADFGGRKTLYLISLVFFIISNILLAALPTNIVALFILRVVQAFGASSVISVGAGTVADTTEPKNRGKAISYFMLGPQLGPVLGPMLSAMAGRNGDSWRWIFGFLAIFGAAVYLLILFCLPETLRYLVGNGEELRHNGYFVKPTFTQKKLVDNFPKPPKPNLKNYYKMLKYIPVLLSCINSALLFAAFYAISVSFTQILQKEYGQTSLEASFSYVVPGVSLILGSLISGRISDRMKKKDSIPEHRIPLQIVGFLLCIAGTILFGWASDRHMHLSLIYISTFLNAFGMTWAFVITTTYLTECFKAQASTSVALVNMFRNLAAAVGSLVVETLMKKMGTGWCFTGLGLCLIICILNVLIIMWKGGKWRSSLQS
jgi:multidrug resistance protein